MSIIQNFLKKICILYYIFECPEIIIFMRKSESCLIKKKKIKTNCKSKMSKNKYKIYVKCKINNEVYRTYI